MRATEFIVETAMMGKIADSGKIIRILKKAHTVPFSDEKNWLLVDTDPGKGNSGLGIKWIPADTRFEWVRPYKDTVDENLSPQTIHKLADRKGVKWDNEPSFLQLTKRLTGKEHLDDLDHSGLNKVKRHLDGLQGVAEEVNSEILSTKNSLPTEKISMGDYEFNAQIYTGELGNPGLQIRAYDPKLRQGIQQIGNADFVVHTDEKGNTWLESDDTAVRPSYYGKGVAAMMYAFAKSLGNDIKPSPYQEPPGKKMWKKWGKDAKNLVGEQGVAESATVTRIDSKPITNFGSNLKAYKHTDDWSQSGVDTGDDSYWKNKNLKTNTTKGLFAGDPRRTALYATGNAYETRYVEFTQDGQPIVYFDRKDLPAMRSRKTYLTVFDASDFRQLPTGEWFSENPRKPIKQVPIGDPFKYIADQGWIVRVTDDLDKVFKQVQKMHKAGKIAHYGAEGMNESTQGVAEGLNEFAVSGNGDGGDDSLFNYAKMWYNGDLKTQRQVEKALQKVGLDIGENEDENGGAYISDKSGDYYESWTAEDLEQGVAEGQDDKAEAYRAHLIKTLPQIMKLFANIGKGWIPSKEQMLSAVDTAYRVMKHTGDVKQAGKVLMDELNTLYRMSQGKQGVAEGFAETLQQLEENLNVDVPNEEWLQNAIDYAIQKSPDRNGLPYMGKTTATARPVEISVSILKRIPGMRREQSNVRHRDLAAIRKIMHTTGKLPLHAHTQEEYKPFINVAYDGSAWVNEGNHRIMAAAELGWPSLPVEISYFDGGERVESGAMYPGKIGLA